MNVANNPFHVFDVNRVPKLSGSNLNEPMDDTKSTSDDSVSLSLEGLKLAAQWQSGENEGKSFASEVDKQKNADTYQFSRYEFTTANSQSVKSSYDNNSQKNTIEINGISVVTAGHRYDTSIPGSFKTVHKDNQMSIENPNQLPKSSENIEIGRAHV